MDKDIVRISKFLSLVLRHKPEEINLELDKGGWANINDLIEKANGRGVNIDYDSISEVVEKNEKKRFIISDDGKSIRANQGHSIDVDLGLKEVLPPDILYHGTATRFIESIKEKGILKCNRHHVHLSGDKSTAVIVGKRHGKPIIIQIDSKKMSEKGIKFYLSENSVWLTDVVSPEYFMTIIDV